MATHTMVSLVLHMRASVAPVTQTPVGVKMLVQRANSGDRHASQPAIWAMSVQGGSCLLAGVVVVWHIKALAQFFRLGQR
jgi:hypothetical protein